MDAAERDGQRRRLVGQALNREDRGELGFSVHELAVIGGIEQDGLWSAGDKRSGAISRLKTVEEVGRNQHGLVLRNLGWSGHQIDRDQSRGGGPTAPAEDGEQAYDRRNRASHDAFRISTFGYWAYRPVRIARRYHATAAALPASSGHQARARMADGSQSTPSPLSPSIRNSKVRRQRGEAPTNEPEKQPDQEDKGQSQAGHEIASHHDESIVRQAGYRLPLTPVVRVGPRSSQRGGAAVGSAFYGAANSGRSGSVRRDPGPRRRRREPVRAIRRVARGSAPPPAAVVSRMAARRDGDQTAGCPGRRLIVNGEGRNGRRPVRPDTRLPQSQSVHDERITVHEMDEGKVVNHFAQGYRLTGMAAAQAFHRPRRASQRRLTISPQRIQLRTHGGELEQIRRLAGQGAGSEIARHPRHGLVMFVAQRRQVRGQTPTAVEGERCHR